MSSSKVYIKINLRRLYEKISRSKLWVCLLITDQLKKTFKQCGKRQKKTGFASTGLALWKWYKGLSFTKHIIALSKILTSYWTPQSGHPRFKNFPTGFRKDFWKNYWKHTRFFNNWKLIKHWNWFVLINTQEARSW